MIAIIDYGAGNLRSVSKGLQAVGATCVIASDPEQLRRADALVMPGVAAASDTMCGLRDRRLVPPLLESLRQGKPFFGICMGLQALMTSSEEGDGEACLDILSGPVLKLPPTSQVPHMGWNQVEQRHADCWLFKDIPDRANFYFVHSFYANLTDPSAVVGETEYGLRFASVVVKDAIVATQFHPEKSGRWGLQMLANFARFAKQA